MCKHYANDPTYRRFWETVPNETLEKVRAANRKKSLTVAKVEEGELAWPEGVCAKLGKRVRLQDGTIKTQKCKRH